jgi:AcrR family transcriptional regulator
MTTSLSGRRAEAARNDALILEAAREVFMEDPTAPVSSVAERAGVGIGALYRRYRSKEALLQQLAADGLQRYTAEVESALADERDPWLAFSDFMRRALDVGANAMSARFAGSFTPTEDLNEAGRRGYQLTAQLLERTKAAGALRADIEVADLHFIFEQLQAIKVADPERTSVLRHRYLALYLEALHLPAASPLPGPPPTWEDVRGRYNRD